MKQDREEKLLRALNDVGDDLVTRAGDCRYAPNPWKRWGAIAASLALVISLTALALPYFPMGCSSSDMAPEVSSDNNLSVEDADGAWSDKNNASGTAPQTPEAEPGDALHDSPESPRFSVTDAVAAMDMVYLTDVVAVPLIRWQVGTFDKASDLSEESMERLYLAVMERDEPWRDPAAVTAGEIRKKLAQVLEGTHIYAPLNGNLPLDGALKELPEITSEFLYVSGQIADLTVRVDGRPMTITIVLDGSDWRYVSVR